MPYDSATMEGLTQRPGAAGETGDVLLASAAQERARAMAGLERLAFAAIAGGVAAAAVVLFGFPAAGTKEPPEAFRAAGTAIPFLAMILILAASRVRGVMLRSARRLALLYPASGRELTAAYRRAIVLDLALLEMVAWFGVAMVPLTGSVRYALVIVVAALLGLVVRWPRRSELDALAR